MKDIRYWKSLFISLAILAFSFVFMSCVDDEPLWAVVNEEPEEPGSGDGYESNNTRATATFISVNGSSQSHTITANDNDWIYFPVTAGVTYAIETFGSTDTYLELYGSSTSSSSLTMDDQGGASENNAKITWTATSSGTWYVKIRGYYATTTGSYTVSVSSNSSSSNDSWEPDNTVDAAKPYTTEGYSYTHTLTSGDVDWRSFFAVAGVTYEILTSGSTDTYLTLYGTNGTSVLTAADGGGSGSNARISWQCTASGTYYFKVQGYSVTSISSYYSLSVTGKSSDAYESDDTYTTASSITVNGSSQAHTMTRTLFAYDVDYMRFSATAGVTYVIETTGDFNTFLSLRGMDGTTQLTFASSGGAGDNARISWQCPTSGTYYFYVVSEVENTLGAYSVSVKTSTITSDGYESDNSYAFANSITVNGSAQSHTLTSSDLDYAYFSATAGVTYVIETTGGTDTYLTLYSTNGTTSLTTADGGGSGSNARISWQCPTTGIYYFKVQGASSSTTGAYSVTVTSSGSSSGDSYESDNTYSAAKSITVNGSAQSRSFTTGDVDWAYFSAQAGYTYTISTTGNLDTYLILYGTNGSSQITYDDDSGPTYNASITWNCSTSGTYYIRAQELNGSTGNYTLSVTR